MENGGRKPKKGRRVKTTCGHHQCVDPRAIMEGMDLDGFGLQKPLSPSKGHETTENGLVRGKIVRPVTSTCGHHQCVWLFFLMPIVRGPYMCLKFVCVLGGYVLRQ